MLFKVNNLRFAVALLAIVIIAPAAVAGSPETFEEAQAKAADLGKPILVDFYAVWCGPCKTFDTDSVSDSGLMMALDQVVLFKIDAERGAGVALAEQYGVAGYPNYALMNAKGEIIHRWLGYLGPADFAERLQFGTDDPTTAEEKRARFEAEPTAEDAALLGLYAHAADQQELAVGYYEKAAELAPQNDYSVELFKAKAYGAMDDLYDADTVIAAADAVIARPNATSEETVDTYQLVLKVGQRTDLAIDELPYLEAAYLAAKNDPEYERTAERLAIEYTFYISEDHDKAVELKWASMPDGWQDDPRQLNAYAWWAFEHKADMERGETLAAKGAALADDNKVRAMVLDTQAEICNALGNCDEAVAIMEQAVQADPESAYYKKQLERFRSILAEAG